MNQALRLDVDQDVRQQVEFLGEPGSRLFLSRFVPVQSPVAGVVICSPTHAELPKNYRREVLLSRSLATQGIAVQRFHYRGAGHSDGDSSLTFETMCQDAAAVAQHLEEVTGVGRLGLLGTRLGGLVAAVTGTRLPSSALALWEPVGGSRYFGEAFRAQLLSDLRRGKRTGTSATSLQAVLEATGAVDVLGYRLERSLYDSLEQLDLDSALGPDCPPTLLVQFGATDGLRPEHAHLACRLRAHGSSMTTATVNLQVSWWLNEEIWQRDKSLTGRTPLLDVTADWLCRELAVA
ncbi:MAG TPA: alpha/beta hydrolase [bacterium]|nr:alpha/beta hydrolase [bacterium]